MMTPIKEDRYENKGRNNDVEIRMSIESQKSVSPRLPPKKENSSPLLEDARKNELEMEVSFWILEFLDSWCG